jgi:hypothetical protein
VARVCQALVLSRATYYHWRVAGPALGRDMERRTQIQAIALELPADGYRRLTHELRRRGGRVNHKRGVRLMREDNLLCLRTRGVVRATDSAHALAVYPKLRPELAVEGLDQLRVADITYVRLPREFVYLAALLEAYRRRGYWLGAGPRPGGRAGTGGPADGPGHAPDPTGIGPSLGSGGAICFAGVYHPTEGIWHSAQHEPHRPPL